MEMEEEGGAKACVVGVVVVVSSNNIATDTIIGKRICLCMGFRCCW